MKKIMAILLSLIMILSLAACANVDPSDDGSDVETITVKMNIIYSEDGSREVITSDGNSEEAEQVKEIPENITNYKMHVENSATVLQILQSMAAQENMEVIVDESETIYVTSIDGVAEDDASGWIFEVNGKSADETTDEGCSEYIPEDGDEITWIFKKY